MTREEAIEAIKCNWPDSRYTILREALDMAISSLRQQDVADKDVGKNEPLTLDELRKMDGEPVWWWNKSAKPVCTICVWDRFMDAPMFANYDWQSEDTLKLSKYKWLKKCGYKPYRQKPEEDDHDERKGNENVRR